jgi:hypothetical protein
LLPKTPKPLLFAEWYLYFIYEMDPKKGAMKEYAHLNKELNVIVLI